MPGYYNKDELKEGLELEQIYDLLQLWGGEPEYIEGDKIISQTICHNEPGHGSRKLYYYSNTRLFRCYTHCGDTFDIFELCIRVMKTQRGEDWELYDAMDYVARYFGIAGSPPIDDLPHKLEDWTIFSKHNIKLPTNFNEKPFLKEYDQSILNRFAYPRIASWEAEGISNEVIKENLIGYYPGGEQITIPHFDIDGRLVGIRGRALSAEDAARFGKYRPLLIGKQLYNHPLSMNLYHLNKSKDNISQVKTAIIFEGEKSCLQYQSYYGSDNDISVACCGSSISSHQIRLLQSLGVNEIIIAFDRQFVEIGDHEFTLLKKKLVDIYKKYSKNVRVTAIFDKRMILPYKSSPTDQGPEIFEKLLRERIVPHD